MWGLVGGIAVVVSVFGLFGCLDEHQKGAFWAVLGIIIGGMGVLYAFELLRCHMSVSSQTVSLST